MSFQEIKISDQSRFNKLLDGASWLSQYQNSELEFANWYVYATSDNVRILWMDDYAIISCNTYGRTVFLPPVCSTAEAFKAGLRKLRELAAIPVIVGITPEMLPFFDEEDMLLLYDDVLAEYIYDAKDLVTLKGAKYHKKRNLFNQFQKKYRFALTDYSPKDREAVLAFLDKHQRQGGSPDDFKALCRALDHLDALGLFADLLWVDQKIVALSIGLQSRFGDHGIVLFEKADYEISGGYAAINTLTAKKHFLNTKYISRQDDYGVPALRKAKHSYHPLYKTKKYACIINRNYHDLHSLYTEAFTDSKKYVDHFFLYQSAPEKTVAVEIDNRAVSGLHLFTRDLVFGEKYLKTAFIVGAATTSQKQRQGLMRQVMKLTLAKAYRNHYPLITLSPVDQAYYEPYGFVSYAFMGNLPDHYPMKPCVLAETVAPDVLNDLYRQATKGFSGQMLRDRQRWIEYMNALAQDEVLFYLILADKTPIGYLAASETAVEELCLVQEVCPLVEGYDFQKILMPSPSGSVPSAMVRIVDLAAFLKSCPMPKGLKIQIKVRFIDTLISENNLTLNLECHDGSLTITPCEEYDVSISIDSLSRTVFTKEKEGALASLFPERKFICFDRY
ncbi:MAG: GNAT family N-acetyltransferase [Acholeplasmataceae bacterium]|nr:GNAT family N-acetyltransferase [Acholeplasmataceae bacterium]